MCGYDHESFWDQTPRTLSLTAKAYNERMTDEHNERAWLAWHIAGLGRTKRMPPLRSMLAQNPTNKPKWEDQLEGLKRWVHATGGKIIYQ